MKTIYLFLFVALFTSVVGSCKKDLTLEPTDFIAPEYYYNTEADLNKALIGVYNMLTNGNLYGMNGAAGLFTTFDQTDEMFMVTSNVSVPEHFDYNSSFLPVADMWNALYRGIERANVLLENIDKPEMGDSARNIIKGQAKFLRAYYYFDLVKNWGDIPLKITSTKDTRDGNIAKSPASEVYDFIIKEMVEAESLVAPRTAYNHSGRITQSAVQGMLARVCLYKAGAPNNDVARYSDALNWANKVIQSGLHELNPNYSQIFINLIQDKYDTKENLWEVEFYSTGAGDFFTRYGGWGAVNGIRQSNMTLGFSNGSCQTYPRLFTKYEEHDHRRDWSIANYQYTNDNGTNKTYWRTDQIYERRVGKWRREYELTASKIQNFTSTNYPVLRYSDVLLMAAEAENYLNGPSNAYPYVNQVRKRGYAKDINGEILKTITLTNGGSGYTSAPTVTISGGGPAQGASAVAIVADGTVTEIIITHRGQFYTSTPTITLSGGGGTDAEAIAVITSPDDYLLKPEQYDSKETMLKTIQDERARELAFEGHRRYDLIRWGIFVSTMRSLIPEVEATAPANLKPLLVIPGQNISEKNIYIPIPLVELTLNPLLIQTEGWK